MFDASRILSVYFQRRNSVGKGGGWEGWENWLGEIIGRGRKANIERRKESVESNLNETKVI